MKNVDQITETVTVQPTIAAVTSTEAKLFMFNQLDEFSASGWYTGKANDQLFGLNASSVVVGSSGNKLD